MTEAARAGLCLKHLNYQNKTVTGVLHFLRAQTRLKQKVNVILNTSLDLVSKLLWVNMFFCQINAQQQSP